MAANTQSMVLPDILQTSEQKPRRLGVEIEFAGLEPGQIAKLLQQLYAGEINWLSPFELVVKATELGDFRIELDSAFVKSLGDESPFSGEFTDAPDGWEKLSLQLLSGVAEQLVPWEVVTAPVAFTELEKLLPLVDKLREAGAKGTRHAFRYAFGLHLNPELPDLSAQTITRYLQAYVCLYDWIVDHDDTDFSRKLTPHINHYPKDYIQQLIANVYQPNIEQLIEDYIAANPTRNRSLDMFPLFAHLDEQTIKTRIADPRIKPRPTFHYRLPNCDIDNADWNLHKPWEAWVQVECLANDATKLSKFREEYLKELQRLTAAVDNVWLSRCKQMLESA